MWCLGHKLDKEYDEIIIEYCKENNHYEVNFYCKNHNQLCCACCITKIKNKTDGKHKDCEVYAIEDIKDEKKNKLKENIKCLKDLSNTLEQSINEL